MKKLKGNSSYLVLILLSGLVVSAQAGPALAPVNPDFQNYIQGLKNNKPQKLSQTAEGYGLGLIPAPVDLSHMKGQQIPRQAKGQPVPLGVTFPASYDLRTQSPKRLTIIKNQNPHNTCWSFATYASLESCLLPSEIADFPQGRDFSESNLINLSGFDYGYEGGGNYQMSTSYLTRWDGPVNESDDSYPNVGGSIAGAKPVQKHVQEVLFIPSRGGVSYYSDNDNIKQMVTTYGAVMTSMYFDNAYYIATSSSYYYSGSHIVNHGVAIVGWDDNYDKSKFSAIPPGNGAFIVRNSYGTTWGDKGYFYVSYYDKKIGNDNAVFESAETIGNYDNVYLYDPLGMTGSCGYASETGWFANIFTASANDQIKAVGFYTLALNSSYEIRIYTAFDGGTNTFTGLLGSVSTGTIPISGYHTIQLKTPITIPGTTFCVVVKLITPGYNSPIPLECPVSGYASPTLTAGKSYVSASGGYWSDSTVDVNGQVCLKAYILNNPTITSITPASAPNTTQVSITNLAGTEFVSGSTVKLSKTGQSDIAATNVTVVSATKITCAFDLNGKAPGSWTVSVSKGSSGSVSATLANGFLVVSSITASSITPASAPNIAQAVTSISGSGFRDGVSVKLSRTGQSDIVASNITIVSPTEITSYFDLNGKAPGSWNVVVSTGSKAGSISATLPNAFLVISSVAVTSITPAKAPNIGQTAITDLAGAGFRTGTTVKLVRPGQSDIAATGVTVISPSSISCTFDLDQKPLGPWNVVVSTGGEGSISSTLANGLVVFSSITVTSISPDSNPNTYSAWINEISGAGFTQDTAVKLTKKGESDINAILVTTNSFTSLSCLIPVDGAAPGLWNVVVSTGGAGSVSAKLPNAFLVTSSITAYAVFPSSAPNISEAEIYVWGGGFRKGVSARLTRSGQNDIVASSVTVEDPWDLVCNFDLNGKAPGSWNLVVSTGGPGSISATLADSFVLVSSITVSSILPDSAYNSRPVSITNLAGGGFVPGSTVKLKKQGQADIAASNINIVNSAQIKCTFNLAGKATGYWDVVASTGGAGTISSKLSGGLLVISSVTISSITPASAPSTRQVMITNLAGAGFMKVTSVKLSRPGESDIAASSITIVNPKKITCAFDLNGKAPGRWDVAASTGGAGSESGALASGFLVVSSITINFITPDSSRSDGPVSTQLTGAGFRTGASAKLLRQGQSNIDATGVTIVSASKLTCTFDLLDKATGYWDVAVTTGGAGSASSVLKNAFLVQFPNIITKKQLNDGIDSTVFLTPDFGVVKVNIPAGTFGQDVILSVSTTSIPSSDQTALKISGVGIEITNNMGLQPCREIMITLHYRNTDVFGFVPSKLLIAYYDPAHNRWVTIPSTVYPDKNMIVGIVKHLTKFAIVQFVAASDMSAVKGYPIPYDPGKGLFTFDNLPATAEIKIFTVAGQLVRKVEYASANGKALWDGKNDGGIVVASGVYVVLIKNDSDKKILKIAVEK